MSARIDKVKVQKNIARMLEHIRAEEDPRVLNEYRAIFKKEISLFRRSWVSAYLLMLSDRGALGQTGKADRADRADKNRARKGGAERPRPSGGGGGGGDSSRKSQRNERSSLPEEESKRLFISTGRNRRVFPRELLGLISAKTQVSRDDIGSIRILDNYSFIQVRDTVAGQIIEALDGSLFRGRPLTVNYAKPRPDDAAEYAEAAESAERSESPVEPYTDGPEDGNDAGFQDTEFSEQAEDHSDEENI